MLAVASLWALYAVHWWLQAVNMMSQQTTIRKVLIVLVACLLGGVASHHMMIESNTDNLDYPTEQDNREAILPNIYEPVNRASFKRAVKRFTLRFGRTRLKWVLIKRYLFGQAIREKIPESRPDTVNDEPQAICGFGNCGQIETDDAPFVAKIGGREPVCPCCVDCAIDIQAFECETAKPYSESDKQMIAYGEKMGFGQAFLALSALALITIFMPMLREMALGLAFVGAVRLPLPQEAKDLSAFYKVRRVAKGRDTACRSCGCALEWRSETDRDVQINMPLAGYKNAKPHCLSCAITKHTGNPPTPKPETPKPADPKPAKPSNDEVNPKPNRYDGTCHVCGSSVLAYQGRLNGKRVLCLNHKDWQAGQPTDPKPVDDVSSAVEDALSSASKPSSNDAEGEFVALVKRLAGDSVNEESVRKIATEVAQTLDRSVFEDMNKTVSHNLEVMEKHMTETLKAEIEKATLPTTLHIKTDDQPAIPAADDGEILHHRFREIFLRIVKASAENLNFVGPAGTGKTTLIEQVFRALKKAKFFKSKKALVHIISCNIELQTSDILGRMSPRFFDDGSGKPAGSWAFTPGKFLDVFSKYGGVLGLDEMDRLHPSTLSGLNAALANGYIIDLDGKKWVRHEDCVVIATGNTRGMGASPTYSASQKQDGASLDRFAVHFMDIDYDTNLENVLCGSVALADEIREIRRLGDAHKIQGVVVSYRAMINCRKMIEGGFTQAYALRSLCEAFGQDAAMLLGHGHAISIEDGYALDDITTLGGSA